MYFVKIECFMLWMLLKKDVSKKVLQPILFNLDKGLIAKSVYRRWGD